MGKMQSAEEFCRFLWEKYLVERRYDIMGEIVAEELSVIGTGAHEVSRNLQEFVGSMERESAEWNGCFLIKDQWYQTTEVSEDISLVIGEILVREDSEDGILYDISFRFSVLLKRAGDSWKLIHVHQSVADPNQSQDEFFPHHMVEKNERQMIYNLRHDTMTGLLNRLYLKNTVNRFLDKESYGVMLMMDIDKFKQMNDCYGHPFGDKVLMALSQSLLSVFAGHLTGRVGGDEFVVYLSGIESRDQTEHILSEFKKDWKERQQALKLPYEITVSVGVVSSPEDGTSYDVLWKNADEALYRAKAGGGGKVSFYE